MLNGVDVSHYQGTIDFQRVAAAGKAFVIVKVTDGAGVDPLQRDNRARAKAAGLVVGTYHFFRPALDPVVQAEHFAQLAGDVSGELAPAVDVEEAGQPDTWLQLDGDRRIDVLCRFVARLEDLVGRRPMIYTRRGYWQSMMRESAALASCPLWIASYSQVPALPDAWPAWSFWQQTDQGTVDGIAGKVDLDVFNGSIEELQQLTRSSLTC